MVGQKHHAGIHVGVDLYNALFDGKHEAGDWFYGTFVERDMDGDWSFDNGHGIEICGTLTGNEAEDEIDVYRYVPDHPVNRWQFDGQVTPGEAWDLLAAAHIAACIDD